MKKQTIHLVSGFFPEEKDDLGTYRWMGRTARLRISAQEKAGKKFLRITAEHSFHPRTSPELEALINGESLGTTVVEPAFCLYAFPFENEGDLDVELRLNRVHSVPEDPRELGIMVRDIQVYSFEDGDVFLDGWYMAEPIQGAKPGETVRWMKTSATYLVRPPEQGEAHFLLIRAGHSFPGEEDPCLTILVDGVRVQKEKVRPEEMAYIFPIRPKKKSSLVELHLDRTFPADVTGDTRELGVWIKEIRVFAAGKDEVIYGEGWFEQEQDEFFPFRWMALQAKGFLPGEALRRNRYVEFHGFSGFRDLSQTLEVQIDGKSLGTLPLLHNWNYYSFDVRPFFESDHNLPEERTDFYELRLILNKPYPRELHEQDARHLGMRVSDIRFHDDDATHQNFLFFHRNAVLNHREMLEGKARLSSYPLNLGVDLFGKCNIKPPCVYCLWDWTKEWEADFVDDVVDEHTFEAYGPFFRSARLLINCSIGEPLLHPKLQDILDYCAKHKKILEISTNGQAFTDRTIQALVGKPIFLYVSLDAASKETYAKIRNDRWDEIIPNLVRLNEERKKRGNLPKLHMVFMPMRVNKHELEDYFRLCRKVDADALILRPLLVLENPGIEEHRAGYHFVYENELLSREELEEIFRECAVYERKYGIPVANQFEFGLEPKQEKGGKRRPDQPHF
ncbi:MAG: radical SAM protein [Candidatus Aminicenantales bacterium]